MNATDRRWLMQGIGGGVALLLAGAVGYVARAAGGGATAETLSYSGVLSGVAENADTSLAFLFSKVGVPRPCTATPTGGRVEGKVTPGGGGVFQTDLKLGPECAGFFDGSDITYQITVNGAALQRTFTLGAVPYAKFADQAGTPDCPAGYAPTVDPRRTDIITCKRGEDEVVRVGTGKSAFWIDRYEASVWGKDGSGEKQYGAGDSNYGSLKQSGQWWTPGMAATPPLYAQSRAGVTPSRFVTWFQAQELCAASGKQLLSRREWFLAIQGTPDPKDNSAGGDGTCVTAAGGPRTTGGGVKCESAWGVQDMIGSLWEWTDEWYAGVGDPDGTVSGGAFVADARQPWPAGYDSSQSDDKTFSGDGTWNIRSHVYDGRAVVNGMPAAALRGGGWAYGPRSGAFALALDSGPSYLSPSVGFRCALPR